MELEYPAFTTVCVNPGKTVLVKVTEGNVWDISNISVVVQDDLSEGRVVLYAAIVDSTGKAGGY